ncbi:hypothetical protein RRG08_011597 [Elysia crispata]|uniref:Uncharacterized protein n=1 Tax=Elysia crispata TaxID=231223 RepID=A0AAE0XNZ9_9GAST|nr:hypothetical protein RRG08_011597 [Elysia crispata]
MPSEFFHPHEAKLFQRNDAYRTTSTLLLPLYLLINNPPSRPKQANALSLPHGMVNGGKLYTEAARHLTLINEWNNTCFTSDEVFTTFSARAWAMPAQCTHAAWS